MAEDFSRTAAFSRQFCDCVERAILFARHVAAKNACKRSCKAYKRAALLPIEKRQHQSDVSAALQARLD
jgi:hypothetical protein